MSVSDVKKWSYPAPNWTISGLVVGLGVLGVLWCRLGGCVNLCSKTTLILWTRVCNGVPFCQSRGLLVGPGSKPGNAASGGGRCRRAVCVMNSHLLSTGWQGPGFY